ncbi:asparagine synthase-related protein [Haloarcula pellucida]|uniref:Asparagine synthetase domain-containing protein n=1 Tax=Haloarcula pellucida TaxID=1427151 RepID=A0A830GPJ7_9EURY|nr:asparagine synthase-related protein [Halomicroarcula pellucida]MBX0348354.1 hypothetical protein [Halomicroarcula pellucida]GGN98135.1 hypothetical protein GCM10009030_28220 [Halomicroarcula pellucida]
MHDALHVVWASPTANRVVTQDGTWILAGTRPNRLAEQIETGADVDDIVEGFDADDAVAVRIGDDGRLDAYRSVTATRNVYVADVPDGPVVVADCFRNALAELPVEDRTVSQRAVADHLLFRNPIEPETYVEAIRGLEHGCHLTYDPATGDRQTRLVDRLDPDGETAVDTAPSRIHDVLTTVLDETLPDRRVRNMLSGGVDSTLLHTYLGDAPALVMATDSPEFASEVDAADRAVAMLDVPTDRHDVAESAFLSHLEASVDALGFPSHYNQTVLTDAVFRAAESGVYVNGEGADALFGLPAVKGARVADRLAPLFAAPGLTTLWRRGVASVLPRATHLPDIASWLDRPITDPSAFAQRLPFYTDPEVVAQCTDEATVESRFRRQTEYVQRRVERSSGGRFVDHAELGHLLSAFRHNAAEQWRQLGYVHGHELVAPFKTRRLTACALSVPPARRYVGGRGSFTPKHLLKSLLKRRLPAYPVRQPKGAGSLPVERYFEDGPLTNVFERYDPPEFVPAAMYEDHVEQFGPVTWNLITFAIWRDRVLQNPDLSRVEGTTVVEA